MAEMQKSYSPCHLRKSYYLPRAAVEEEERNAAMICRASAISYQQSTPGDIYLALT